LQILMVLLARLNAISDVLQFCDNGQNRLLSWYQKEISWARYVRSDIFALKTACKQLLQLSKKNL
jgi:hypothetical protein